MLVKEPISLMIVGTKRGREAKETLLFFAALVRFGRGGRKMDVMPLTSQNSTAPESTTWDP